MVSMFLGSMAIIGLSFMSITFSKKWQKVLAVVLAVAALYFTVAQGYSNQIAQDALREEIKRLGGQVDRVVNAIEWTDPAGASRSRKVLKHLALDLSDNAEAFWNEVEEHRRSLLSRVASAHAAMTTVRGTDPAAVRCESFRAEAKSLRDKMLFHLPAEARDARATASYTSSGCLESFPVVIADLKRTALRLPD